MRILLLGESGSKGAGLADPETAWGNSLPVELERLTGERPESVHVRFFIWAKGADEYLEEYLQQGPFDVVILSQTKFGFTVWSADNRIRKVLGNRVADWFKHTADSFDGKTRVQGDEGLKRKANRLAHRSVRKVIGQAPTMSARGLTDAYLKVLARLARLEATQVIVVGSSHVSGALARLHPEVVGQTTAFRETIRLDAARRSFDWVDRVTLMQEAGGEHDKLFLDGLHKGEEVHRRIAAALVEKIIERNGGGRDVQREAATSTR